MGFRLSDCGASNGCGPSEHGCVTAQVHARGWRIPELRWPPQISARHQESYFRVLDAPGGGFRGEAMSLNVDTWEHETVPVTCRFETSSAF
jgi:hypothetical protein